MQQLREKRAQALGKLPTKVYGISMNINLITTTEAGRLLGVHRSRVWVLIRDGRLLSRLIGGRHLIDECDLVHVKDRPPGRPKKKLARQKRST